MNEPTAEPLGDTSARVLAAISAFRGRHGYSPSVRELAEMAGLVSTSSVAYHLRILRARGYITFHDGLSRSIVITRRAP